MVDCHHRLIPLDSMIQPDKDMQDLVDAVLAPHRAMLDTVVGRTDTLLDRATSLSAPMETFFWPPLPALRERTSPSRMAGATAPPAL